MIAYHGQTAVFYNIPLKPFHHQTWQLVENKLIELDKGKVDDGYIIEDMALMLCSKQIAKE